jgi:biopolymer transport protein ExbD
MGASHEQPVSEMNTTPLIDVMLVLLIMFVITVPIMTHAVKLDLPTRPPDTPPPERPEVVELEIDFDGTVVWNGAVVPSASALESYFRQEAGKARQPEIHLRADGRAMYGDVATVLAAAQRNRLQKIGFVNLPEFGR